MTALPPNFRDAVSITRKLGMRYIWIDSVCIVQDDEKEWELQSTYMGLIYANTRCVISATASKDTEGGCYRPRDLYRSALVLREKGDEQLAVYRKARLSELFREKVDRSPVSQ